MVTKTESPFIPEVEKFAERLSGVLSTAYPNDDTVYLMAGEIVPYEGWAVSISDANTHQELRRTMSVGVQVNYRTDRHFRRVYEIASWISEYSGLDGSVATDFGQIGAEVGGTECRISFNLRCDNILPSKVAVLPISVVSVVYQAGKVFLQQDTYNLNSDGDFVIT